MKNRKTWFLLSLTISIIVIVLLMTGSPLLLIDVSKGVPSGTFITWAGQICLPLSLYLGVKELRTPTNPFTKILSTALWIVLIAGILWVTVCYFLAGNMSFTFTEKATFRGGQSAMRWFWRYSYGIAIGSLAIFILHFLSRFVTPKSQPE